MLFLDFCYYLFGKIGYVFLSIVCCVCLSVCKQHYPKIYEQIAMKFYGGVGGGAVKKRFNFGGDLGLVG